MVTDNERREVARRLREIELSKGGYIAWWKMAKALKLEQLDGWFGWEKFDPDSAKRLADLIEPGEQKVKYVAEVKVDGERLEQLVHDAAVELTDIDRDALLALADDLDYAGAAVENVAYIDQTFHDAARRIREALGVER